MEQLLQIGIQHLNNQNERCKLNIFISGKKLKTENLKVTSFCQEFKNQIWINKKIDKENNIKIENAILNKAKKLKTSIKLKSVIKIQS